MKKLLLGITVLLLCISCEKDPQKAFVGEWTLVEGGTVTFNENFTGYSVNGSNAMASANHFENICDDLDTNFFNWTATQSGNKKTGILELTHLTYFNAQTCVVTSTDYDIHSNNRICLGSNTEGSDQITTLKR
jgi:hypothetical protein